MEKTDVFAHNGWMESLVLARGLAPYVKAIRIGHATEESARYRRLPDGETELMLTFGAGAPLRASLIGTRTSALNKATDLGASALLVRFRLGAAHAFFGRPMSELTDRVVPLDALWSAREVEPLMAAAGQTQLQAAFTQALQARFARPYEPASARSVRRALQRIAQAADLPRVPALAAELGISERQLRRGFDQVIGISPKHYLRIARFQRALRAARAAQHKPDWAALAEGCGYFDQAHLISDFREMTGLTPAVLVG